tara:strand:+ start:122 stop:601 length:480 start_codon:yes stop_codon:yes gene_type:complete
MINKKYKGIWFYGISGSGKTQASKYIKKYIKNSIILDGDEIRKKISFDLDYSIKDRKIQIRRIYGIISILLQNKIFPIVSTVYLDQQMKNKLINTKILTIQLFRNLKLIKNRKLIYSKKTKNVIGKDLKMPLLKKDIKIINNKSKREFQKRLYKLIYVR